MGQKRQFSPKQIADMHDCRRRNWAFSRIGLRYGISKVAVYNICAGITYRELHPDKKRADPKARSLEQLETN